MLVLTRKVDQKICLGDNIVITVLKIQGDQISIGIEAPKDLQIVREELLKEKFSPKGTRLYTEGALKEN